MATLGSDTLETLLSPVKQSTMSISDYSDQLSMFKVDPKAFLLQGDVSSIWIVFVLLW